MVTPSKLQRKLLRDLLAGKAQFGAVIVIIILGVAAFVAIYGSYQNLYLSYNDIYERMNMADYWISADALPSRAVREMDQIVGVEAQGRIIGDVSIDLEVEGGQKVEGRVISLPAGVHPEINDVVIESGDYISPGANREILLERGFADFHKLEQGDWLTIEEGSRKIPLKVMGAASSPEYLWVTKNFQELIPSPKTFGILFMPVTQAEGLFNMKGMVNDVNLVLGEDIEEEEVLMQVEEILRRYGIKRVSYPNEPVPIGIRKIDVVQGVRTAHIVDREYMPSHHLLKQDLDGFKQMSVMFPLLFLSLAALAIYVLLNRLIESQRVQIGLMRALGYSKMKVLWHYISFGLALGLLGSISGALLGHVLAGIYTNFYIGFLRIPYAVTEPQWTAMLIGFFMGTLVPLFAGVLPAWGTARLRPAEAMRPPVPAAAHRTLLEILLPFMSRLPFVLKIPLRNVFRNPRRSMFMATGVMSATAMILLCMSFVDMMDWINETQIEQIQSYDAKVIFQGFGSEGTARRIEQFQGVDEAEAILELPYRIKLGDKVRDSAIRGMKPGSSMYKLLDPDGIPVPLTDDGLLLPLPLQEQLEAEAGDILYLEPLIGSVGETTTHVTGIVSEPMGARAYMPLEQVQDLIKMHGAATGVLLNFTGQSSPELLERINNLPQVASIEFGSSLKDYMDDMMGFFWAFVGIMLVMSFALGFAIIFNGVTVNVLERRREIAIMRAVGMRNRQLGLIITLENLLIAFLGIAVGLPAGYYLADYFMQQNSTDMMSMPMVLHLESYFIAAGCSIVILLVSQLPAIRRVTTMSLPTVTKDWSE